MAYRQPNQSIMNSGETGSPVHYVRHANPPSHPSMVGEMPSVWLLRDGRRANHIPCLPNFTPSQESFPSITFSVNGWPGVRVEDICNQTVYVDHLADFIFAYHGWQTTNLALNWPGYLPNSSSDTSHRRIVALSGEHGDREAITRQAFAQEIASLIAAVYDRSGRRPVARGWESWALNKDNVQPSDIIILSAHYYRDVWIPELYIIERGV
ncbi:hypothetical protein EDB19DRAFT_497363 [Suillus lakei]|nr:hypothetical protein EDB19DRAFT_497363 [Suillus lakei]